MKNILIPITATVLACYDTGDYTPTSLARHFGVSQSGMRSFLIKHQRDVSRVYCAKGNTLSETDAAYLAGLIDGEGCIFAHRVRSRKTVGVKCGLVINMTAQPLLEEIQTITGTGSLVLVRDTKNDKWKDCWRWDVASQASALVLRQALPYLKLKRPQALLLLDLVEIKSKSTTWLQNDIERQFKIVEQMQALNKRGKAVGD